MKHPLLMLAAFAFSSGAIAADYKIGFVNTERILRDAPISVRAQKKLEKEFQGRETELQKLGKQGREIQAHLEKEGVTMSESDRQKKERELANLNREFQRLQREFREDLNLRRNEELAQVQEKARKAIQSLAENEKYDIILETGVVYVSPKIDITDKVVKVLEK